MSPSNAARVIVFGECLVDRFGEQSIAGGAPFNVARHLAALGLAPVFVTRVGDDGPGRQLRAELARFGLGEDALQIDPLRPTGQVRVHERDGHHDFEILPDQAYDHIEARDWAGWAAADGEPLPWITFGTLGQRHAHSRAALAALRAAVPHRACVDVNWRTGQVGRDVVAATLAGANVLKLNAEELALLLRWQSLASLHAARPPAPGTGCAAIAALLAPTRVAQLIVTYGAAGYALWERDGSCRLRGTGLAAPAIVDTVGAGDAFCAITLAGCALSWPWEITLSRANAFAAAICGVRGAAPAGLEFYERWKVQWGLSGAAPRSA